MLATEMKRIIWDTRGQFERIPKWLNLFPMIAQWLWLSARYGSVSLPSSANPAITSGGLVGEGKIEYFDIMGAAAREKTADFIALRATDLMTGEQAAGEMHAAGIGFPVVAKPDIGWCGYGIRLLHDEAQLEQYIRGFPAGEKIVLQRFIPDKGEAGIFYMRSPQKAAGEIIGILLRSYPRVTGDGKSKVSALVARDFRLQRLTGSALHECSYDPEYIPAENEEVRLSLIASTRVGGLYEDGSRLVTPALAAAVDAVAKDMKDFYVGRFDVRYRDAESLQQGHFTIMEVNGAGSEAVHAWDPKYTIPQVYGIVFAKQRRLFAISAENRKNGHPPIGIRALAKLYFAQQRLIRRYPPSN